MTVVTNIMFDRRGAEPLLKAIGPTGWAHSLIDFAVHARLPLDLQFRGHERRPETWATLYMGLEKVLDFRFDGRSKFRLRPHKIHGTAATGFQPTWQARWHGAEDLKAQWVLVERYLERVIPLVSRSALVEGALQAGVSTFRHHGMVVIDRESQLTYADDPLRRKIQRGLQRPLLDAVVPPGLGAWSGRAPTSLGGECDALAISLDGTLLTIEVKPRDASGTIPWAPLQARNYANLFQGWMDSRGNRDSGLPKQVVDGMSDQRKRVGLTSRTGSLNLERRVQPVVAIQRGASEVAISRMHQVQERLVEAGLNDPPMLFCWATMWGELVPMDW